MPAEALWMRWLDFRRLRDLLSIVADHDCTLRAADLNDISVRSGVLVNERGNPFKPTTIYHYRRTLERLGLVHSYQQRYCIAREKPVVVALLSAMRKGSQLSLEERRALATLVVSNSDCYEVFFKGFTTNDHQPQDVDEFVRAAEPVSVHIDSKAARGVEVKLHNLGSELELRFCGESAVQAIFWGLRSWCVDQLQFIDEVFLVGAGYVLYPRVLEAPWPADVTARRLIELLDFKDRWAVVRVEELVLAAGRRWRLPRSTVREALLWLNRQFPGYIAMVPTSEQFIMSGVHPSHRRAVQHSYLRLPTGEFVSHVRIHSDVANMMIEQIEQEVGHDN